MVLGTTFQCAPIDFTWNKGQSGQCINIEILFVTLGIVNAVTDIIIVIMPLPLIWKLKMPRGRKIGICGIFALSSIVIVASIVRPIYLGNLNTYDLTCKSINMGIEKLSLICHRRRDRHRSLVYSGARPRHRWRIPTPDGSTLQQDQGNDLFSRKEFWRHRIKNLGSRSHSRWSVRSIAKTLAQRVGRIHGTGLRRLG